MKNKKILYVSSAGGHFNELEMIIMGIEKIKKYEYVVCTEDKVSDDKVNYYLKYGSRSKIYTYVYIYMYNFFKSFYILIKEKPNILITTGAHTCTSFLVLSKIFKIKTIYVESFAKVNTPSLTYTIFNKFMDCTIVQHKEMLDIYTKSKYFGGIY